jgi:hypothetical protein
MACYPLTGQLCMQVKDFGKGMTPINRAGQPRELAPTFVYLANNGGAVRILPSRFTLLLPTAANGKC